MSSEPRSSSPVDDKSEKSERDSPEPVAGRKRQRAHDPDEEADEDEGDSKEEDGRDNGVDGEEDEGEEDDDDEDEEDDEEDDEAPADGERKKKRRRKSKKYRFLDVEAEVDDEEEEEDEADENASVADFIDGPGDEPVVQDDMTHRNLDRSYLGREEDDVQDVVRRLKERHGRQAAARYNADSDTVPQRLLMPGVNDPSLWQVRCKNGRELEIIGSIFRKVHDSLRTLNPIDIVSAFYRSSLDGMLFIEARQAAAVTQAITGIVGVYISQKVKLVPIEEMAPLLKIKKKDINAVNGQWVRMKRGKYAGDLAQVIDTDGLTNEMVGIKFIPRIDFTPKDKRKDRGGKGNSGARPPARLFAYEDVSKVYGRKSVRPSNKPETFFFDNDEYSYGFCEKDVKLNMISADNVKPTLEEIARFMGDRPEDSGKIDLAAIAEANKDVTASILFPGDMVEVHDGEQSGLYGKIVTVTADTVAIRAEGGEVHGQTIEVPPRSVRKRFEVGEHVKVLSGQNVNVSGMVVEVVGDVVTLMSDQGEQEIKVFSKDIRKAADIAGNTAQTGIHDLHDMVMLDSMTAGVIIKLEGGLLRVLDQNGAPKVVGPQQVRLRRENRDYAVATDAQGNDMKIGDTMKEVEGEHRQGEVINIFRSLFVFLKNRELTENNGVFVARAQALMFVTPKSATSDLNKLNPALQAQLPYGGASLMPPPTTTINKGRVVNSLVVVVKGTSKGLMGVIKDVIGENARVELTTNNKTLTINLTSLKRKDPKTGQTYPLETGAGSANGGRMGGYDVNPYTGNAMGPPNGGMTPAAGYGGRTPAPGSAFGRTPNPYAGGYGGGKTPNPYAAAAGAGGRTPAPGTWSAGGKTPGWAGGGGKTPAPGMLGGRTPAPGMGYPARFEEYGYLHSAGEQLP